jgi:hypothetical protein
MRALGHGEKTQEKDVFSFESCARNGAREGGHSEAVATCTYEERQNREAQDHARKVVVRGITDACKIANPKRLYSNVATTPAPPFGMVTVQLSVEDVHPCQPEKVSPALGVAVSTTEAPIGTVAIHETAGQLIP